MNLSKVSVFKSNLARFLPKKINCSRCLKSEEKLFIQGIKLYHEKINLANFLRRVDEIEEDVTDIKISMNKKVGRSPDTNIGTPNSIRQFG